jgi:hypothetical protein
MLLPLSVAIVVVGVQAVGMERTGNSGFNTREGSEGRVEGCYVVRALRRWLCRVG